MVGKRRGKSKKILNCNLCEKTATTVKELSKHRREQHGRDLERAKFKCTRCLKTFKFIRNYKTHMKRHIHKHHKAHAKSNMIENKAYQDENSKDIFRPGHEFSDSIKATSIPPENSESISSENLLRRSVMVGGNNVTQISNENNREQAIYNRDLVKLCKMIRLHFK